MKVTFIKGPRCRLPQREFVENSMKQTLLHHYDTAQYKITEVKPMGAFSYITVEYSLDEQDEPRND